MRKMKLAVSFLVIISSLGWIGCEVGSLSEPIYISPSTVTVRKGDTVQFTASGGYYYEWQLQSSGSTSSTLGTLSSTRGQTITYTSLYDPGTNNVVNETIRVISTIPGDATGTNSTSAVGGEATATITHIGS